LTLAEVLHGLQQFNKLLFLSSSGIKESGASPIISQPYKPRITITQRLLRYMAGKLSVNNIKIGRDEVKVQTLNQEDARKIITEASS
jgi:hypothetical protein